MTGIQLGKFTKLVRQLVPFIDIGTKNRTYFFVGCRIYAASPTAISLLEMEGRAIVVSGSYLSLTGILTVFALNEPLWTSTFQLTQFQTGEMASPIMLSLAPLNEKFFFIFPQFLPMCELLQSHRLRGSLCVSRRCRSLRRFMS